MSNAILLVEDDVRLGDEVCQTLEDAGFDVTWVRDGNKASSVVVDDFDLVVLDLMLPGKHGFDLLKDWRQTSEVPVIILTARTDTFDKVRGFKLGGDDYMTKPFWPEELTARIQARLRRPTMDREEVKEIGPIEVSLDARSVAVNGADIELTKVEFDIIALLFRRLDKPVSRRQLVDQVLDEEREGGERTLDVHVSRIRKKLGEAAPHLETVWGVGYRLATQPKEKKK